MLEQYAIFDSLAPKELKQENFSELFQLCNSMVTSTSKLSETGVNVMGPLRTLVDIFCIDLDLR